MYYLNFIRCAYIEVVLVMFDVVASNMFNIGYKDRQLYHRHANWRNCLMNHVYVLYYFLLYPYSVSLNSFLDFN